MKALIVSGGDVCSIRFLKLLLKDRPYIICADKGYDKLKQLDILPDLIIGDFDSVTAEIPNCKIIKYPPEKNETDTLLALKYAIDNHFTDIVITGFCGTRLDHTLSNIEILKVGIENNVKVTLADEFRTIYLIKDQITLTGNISDIVSLIPYTDEVFGITTNGLYYPLVDAHLVKGHSTGVSNKMTSCEAKISIQQGLLLVIKSVE